MKTFYAVVFTCVLFALSLSTAQTTGTVVVVPPSPTASLFATAGTLVCTFTANSAKTMATATCSNGATSLPVTVLDVSQPNEGITYGITIAPNAITALFSQAATPGTLGYQVSANGSTTKSGNF